MSEVTRILQSIEDGDPKAAEKLLPLVYDELRKLAASKMAQEQPGQTLQATALVHEAYIRLVDVQIAQKWDSRGHFFSAAAEAMRRIQVDNARRQQSLKRGGGWKKVELGESRISFCVPEEDLLSMDEAIGKLSQDEPQAAELVKLRYFVGLPLSEAAEVLGLSRATASRYWAYAKAFLVCELADEVS